MFPNHNETYLAGVLSESLSIHDAISKILSGQDDAVTCIDTVVSKGTALSFFQVHTSTYDLKHFSKLNKKKCGVRNCLG